MTFPDRTLRDLAMGALGLLLSVGAVEGQSLSGQLLQPPPVLENLSSQPGTVTVELTAEPERLSLLPGVETDVFAYNGTVPGPTLELEEGDRVTVRFRNELPEPTTVHWHGFRLPIEADGSPFHPVGPGEEYEYTFSVPPGTAGTYWYHPHPQHSTGYQIVKGLHGAVVVRDPDDPLPDLPEKLLILSDNRFDEEGAIDFAGSGTRQARLDAENGREGDVIFVNGQVMPSLEIRPGEVQRWRVVNASGARVYRLALPGHTLFHVGNDGGLFEEPREVGDVLVANSERVELLVRGTGSSGQRVALESLPYDRYLPQTRPDEWDEPREILTLVYTEEPRLDGVEMPEALRSVPALDPEDATVEREMVLTKNRINGRKMDMDRIDEATELGATEIWKVENLVGMDHPFHLHGFRFQVLERDGQPEPFRSWKDVVNVPKRSTVRFIVRFDGHPGRWMFHCHIVNHEDAGMMGVLEVRPEDPGASGDAASGDRPAGLRSPSDSHEETP